MNEKPILFNGPMVQAILNDRKTQTRRVIKGAGNSMHLGKLLGEWSLSSPPCQYDRADEGWPWNWKGKKAAQHGDWMWELQSDVDDSVTVALRCPYGKPGDTLWVRETWRIISTDSERLCIQYRADEHRRHEVLCYKDFWFSVSDDLWDKYAGANFDSKWRPSIFMPRLFSRIALRVKSVRVERVQEISHSDAMDEGIWHLDEYHNAVDHASAVGLGTGSIPLQIFEAFWDSINAKRGFSWSNNPWVWVVEFQKVE